jgi:hypothetical protein
METYREGSGEPWNNVAEFGNEGKVLLSSTEAAGSRFESTNQDVDALG